MACYPSPHVLKLVLNFCNIPSFNKNVPDLCSCCIWKSRRLSSNSSDAVYTSPLELSFTDIWDPHILFTLIMFPLLMHILSSHGLFF